MRTSCLRSLAPKVGAACALASFALSPANSEPAKQPETAHKKSDQLSLLQPLKSAYQRASDSVYDAVVKPFAEPSRTKLLPDLPPNAQNVRPTLVISLDGCLIESVYSRQHGWRYIKRPGLDAFLEQLAPFYELVLWTDAMNTADPVVDRFDPRRRIRHRLYRDTTTYSGGHHRKDLDVLNRRVDQVIIIDTDPESFSMHPRNGILVPKYISEEDPKLEDAALTSLVPFLQYLALSKVEDLREELETYRGCDIGKEFERRLPELRASGKLRLPRRVGASAAAPRGTIWERLRARE